MNRRVLLILAVLLVNLLPAFAETIVVPTVGQYSTIDTSIDIQLIEDLKSADSTKKEKALKEIIDNLNKHNPVVACLAGNIIFKEKDKFTGLRLYFIGRLRVTYDILRCADKTVQDTLQVIDEMFGPDFLNYINSNEPDYKRANIEAIDFFESNDELYDQRWINLRGMAAVREGVSGKPSENPLSVPKLEWQEIKKKIVESYRKTFPKP